MIRFPTGPDVEMAVRVLQVLGYCGFPYGIRKTTKRCHEEIWNQNVRTNPSIIANKNMRSRSIFVCAPNILNNDHREMTFKQTDNISLVIISLWI